MAALTLSDNHESVALIGLEAASMSERQSRVVAALNKKFEYAAEFTYTLDVYDDFVIYRSGAKLFKLGYSFNDNLEVTFDGDAVEVIVQYTPVTEMRSDGGQTPMPDPKDTPNPEVVELRTQLTTLTATVTQLQESLTTEHTARVAVEKELNRTKAEAKVRDLMAAGKIVPAQKDWAIEFALSNPESFDTFAEHQPVVIKLDTVHGNNPPPPTGGDDPVKKFTAAVDEHITKNTGVKYGDAVRAVSLNNPELAEAYRQALVATE
jgi:hypothetical protein